MGFLDLRSRKKKKKEKNKHFRPELRVCQKCGRMHSIQLHAVQCLQKLNELSSDQGLRELAGLSPENLE